MYRSKLGLVLILVIVMSLTACGSVRDEVNSQVKKVNEDEKVIESEEDVKESEDTTEEEIADEVDTTLNREEDGDFIWEGDLIVTVSDTGKKKENIVIPKRCKGFKEEEGGVFGLAFDLKTISFESDEDIDLGQAFELVDSVEEIKLPKNLTKIGDHCFAFCENLVTLDIPESVTEIGDSAFKGCIALSSITIPEGVKELPNMAFSKCGNLKSINLPSSLIEIGPSVFSTCESLESIEIPENVEHMGEGAFYRCKSLKSVDIPNKTDELEAGLFHDCTSLESVEIPSKVEILHSDAFNGCASLKSISIPETVSEIDARVFMDCSSLASVEINSNAQLWGYVFHGCPIKDLTFSDNFKVEEDEYIYSCFDYNNDLNVHLTKGSWLDLNFDSVFSIKDILADRDEDQIAPCAINKIYK